MTFHFRNFAPRIASDTQGNSTTCSPCFLQSAFEPMKVQAACTMTFVERAELDDWVLNLWPLDCPPKEGSSSRGQYEIVCLWDQRTRLPLEFWVVGRDADAPEDQGYSVKKTLLAGKLRGRGFRRSLSAFGQFQTGRKPALPMRPHAVFALSGASSAIKVGSGSARRKATVSNLAAAAIRRSGRPTKRAVVERLFAKATADLVAGLDGNRPPRNEGNTKQARG